MRMSSLPALRGKIEETMLIDGDGCPMPPVRSKVRFMIHTALNCCAYKGVIAKYNCDGEEQPPTTFELKEHYELAFSWRILREADVETGLEMLVFVEKHSAAKLKDLCCVFLLEN